MTEVDYTFLFDRDLPDLGIDFGDPGDLLPWRIMDRRTNRLYSRAASLDHAVAFIRSAVKYGDATADEDSIEFHRMLRLQAGHSVRVDAVWAMAQLVAGALPEQGNIGPGGGDPDRFVAAPSVPGTPCSGSARVLPFRRSLEPVDEVG